MNRTFVYIDGFNLYYGCLKETPYRWLDLSKLIANYYKSAQVIKIKYFTALVSARVGDPEAPGRQNRYLRALRTLPNLEIHLGHFLTHETWLPYARPQSNGKKFACVIREQEKGSDVNLASHLLYDAFKEKYDHAIVVSNDADLFTPMRMVNQDLKKKISILNPQERPSRKLLQVTGFIKQIREGSLAVSQFPPVLTDKKGSFSKPDTW
jgi:uncharacterized LabA/DUF88 family protein